MRRSAMLQSVSISDLCIWYTDADYTNSPLGSDVRLVMAKAYFYNF